MSESSRPESCRVKRQNVTSKRDKTLQLPIFDWKNDSRFPTPSSKGWHNDYLHKRQGQEYNKLIAPDLCKLGESWITMFYGGSVAYVAPVTVLLALHLRSPVNYKELFSPFAQNPKFPPGFKGDPVKDMIKSSQQLTDVPAFLASEEQEDELEKLLKKGSTLGSLIAGIKHMEAEKQAAFYSFLAAITCRLVCKSDGHIARIWECRAVDSFKHFYKIPHVNFVIPPPDIRVLGHLKTFLSLGSDFAVALYKAYLPIYSEVCAESNNKVKQLLDFTFLQHTSMTGLGIVTYLVQAARYENFSSLKEFFLKVHSNAMETSMKPVWDFMEQYVLARPPNHELDWWKWARNIDANSFHNLSLRSRGIRQLAIICMGLLANSEKDNIWNAPGVNATKLEIRNIMQLLKNHKALKRYTPRPRFNIEKELEFLHL